MFEVTENWTSCKCPIWDSPAERRTIHVGALTEYKSSRAGGNFRLTRSAEAETKIQFNRRLTTEILRSNLMGACPKFTSNEIPENDDAAPLTVVEKYNAFLLVLSNCYPKIGSDFRIKDIYQGDVGRKLQAGIGSENPYDGADRVEIEHFLAASVSKNHIVRPISTSSEYQLSFQGWQMVESLGLSLNESDQIFVAMWFGSDEQTELYKTGIKPAIEAAGYTPIRIDDTQHNAKIDDQIIAEIRKSKAIIVDMTCGLAKPIGNWGKSDQVGAPRGGVFYEAGFAAGLNLPVIWTVKKEQAEIENVVHFDVRQFNQIRWTSDLADFSERLRFRIEATLGRGNSTK